MPGGCRANENMYIIFSLSRVTEHLPYSSHWVGNSCVVMALCSGRQHRIKETEETLSVDADTVELAPGQTWGQRCFWKGRRRAGGRGELREQVWEAHPARCWTVQVGGWEQVSSLQSWRLPPAALSRVQPPVAPALGLKPKAKTIPSCRNTPRVQAWEGAPGTSDAPRPAPSASVSRARTPMQVPLVWVRRHVGVVSRLEHSGGLSYRAQKTAQCPFLSFMKPFEAAQDSWVRRCRALLADRLGPVRRSGLQRCYCRIPLV